MRIVSWNINGIRSLKNDIKDVLHNLDADIICFQEVKANRSTLEESIINVPGYSSYFNFPKHQSGYSGVATFCRNSIRPTHAEEGLSGEFLSPTNSNDAVGFWPCYPDISTEQLKALESEGRAIITKHNVKVNNRNQEIAVINVYCPRVDCLKPERATYQIDFFKVLQRRAEEIHKSGCGVFIVGDINTCRQPIDTCDPGDLSEFSKRPNRQWLNGFLQPTDGSSNGSLFVDSFRHFYPDKKGAYTCWCNLTGARKTNYGTRIDYILVDKSTIELFEDSLILSDYEGSDHCPVAALVNCETVPAQKCPSICSKYWPEFSGKQKKLTAFLKVKEESQIQSTAKRQKFDSKPRQLSLKCFLIKNSESSSPSSESSPSSNSSQEVPLSNSLQEVPLSDKRSLSDVDVSCQQGSQFIANIQQSQNQRSSQVSAWKQLLKGPPKAPKCIGHQELCLLRTVQKEGPNYGRQFFVCPRPIGDKSNKEARCDYFAWVGN